MTEQEYDDIMSEARKIYEYRWKKIEDPYAFHKAFEWAQRKMEENED